MTIDEEFIVEMVPIKEINILNPRVRNIKKFQKIVTNIANIGLKRPITVSELNTKGEKRYNLVCGQGRLEAYIALGEDRIPAIVKNIPEEECFLMSLVENLARRNHLHVEYVKQIGLLSKRGYKPPEIAKKIDANPDYVRGILRLLENGEERLISAVIKEQIPISTAVDISAAKDEKAQIALLEAYESNKLRGRALMTVRRILEKRRLQGKTLRGGATRGVKNHFSADALVRTYKKETERRKLLIKKAKICEARLLFITSALKGLIQDQNYVDLLQAEQLDSMPKNLMKRIKSKK